MKQDRQDKCSIAAKESILDNPTVVDTSTTGPHPHVSTDWENLESDPDFQLGPNLVVQDRAISWQREDRGTPAVPCKLQILFQVSRLSTTALKWLDVLSSKSFRFGFTQVESMATHRIHIP